MLNNSISAGLAMAALLALPVLAQTAGAPATTTPGQSQPQTSDAPAGQFIAQQPSTSMRLSKLKGVDVIGLDHHRIGDIDEVLIDRDGRVQAVVVGVGGFLGIGSKNVAIPFDQLLWNTGDVSRVASPSASTTPGEQASAGEARTAAAERMPGANISNEVLNAVPEQRSGRVEPGTGPVTTGATGPATVPVVSPDGPVQAMVRLTKADLQNAPEFRYSGQDAGGDSSSSTSR